MRINACAPIALFVFNRPDILNDVINALKKNELSDMSEIFIFSDNAKTENQVKSVKKVREIIKNVTGFKSVNIIERENNYGLSKSIITGINHVLSYHKNIIVLEDDHITSPKFLKYMNMALETFKDEQKIASISGYSYPTKNKLPDYFFLKRIECWGWATWSDQWSSFNDDGNYLLNEIKKRKQEKEFDFNNSFSFVKMLEDQTNGLNDSWAIRWDASVFLSDKLNLYPGKSFVQNIGMDGLGTNCGVSKDFDVNLNEALSSFSNLEIKNSSYAWMEYESFYRSLKKPFYKSVLNKVSSLFNNNFKVIK